MGEKTVEQENSFSNLGKYVHEGDQVLVCQYHSPRNDSEVILVRSLSPSCNELSIVCGGNYLDFDTRFTVTAAASGVATIEVSGTSGSNIRGVSTAILRHLPKCKVGDRVAVLDEYCFQFKSAAEIIKHFPLFVTGGEVTATGAKETTIKFLAHEFTVPTRFVVTEPELSGEPSPVEEEIRRMLGELNAHRNEQD